MNTSGQRNNSSQVPFLILCQFVERKKRLTLLRTYCTDIQKQLYSFISSAVHSCSKPLHPKDSRVCLLIYREVIKKLHKRTKLQPLWEEWNPVRKVMEDVLVFCGFGRPPDTPGSMYMGSQQWTFIYVTPSTLCSIEYLHNSINILHVKLKSVPRKNVRNTMMFRRFLWLSICDYKGTTVALDTHQMCT